MLRMNRRIGGVSVKCNFLTADTNFDNFNGVLSTTQGIIWIARWVELREGLQNVVLQLDSLDVTGL